VQVLYEEEKVRYETQQNIESPLITDEGNLNEKKKKKTRIIRKVVKIV